MPVDNAKAISTATAKRRAGDARRSEALAKLTGGLQDTSSDEPGVAADAASELDTGYELEGAAEAQEPASIELSAEDVEALARQNNTEVEQEQVGSHKFVTFKDVIPPCPPRGMFDVRRIKDSAYFFS